MGETLLAPVWEGDGNTPNFVGDVETASEFLAELSDRRPGDSVKTAINNASKRAGLSYWRAFDIWYRKARRIEAFEQEAIQAALTKKRRTDARQEFHELQTRMSRLESMLAQSDPDFHRDTLEHLRSRK